MTQFVKFDNSMATRRGTTFDYATMTWADFHSEVLNPPAVSKAEAPCAIFSTYHTAGQDGDTDARGHKAQFDHGQFVALWADIDAGDPSLEQVINAVRQAVGDVYFYIYGSPSYGGHRDEPQVYTDLVTGQQVWSAPIGSVKLKYRVVVPLAQPIPGLWYKAYAEVFNCSLGLLYDPINERHGQFNYRPTRTSLTPYINPGQLLDPTTWQVDDVRQTQQKHIEAEQARSKRQQAIGRTDGRASPIAAFLRKYGPDQILEMCGFLQNPRKPKDWRHPDATSKTSYPVELRDDGSVFALNATAPNWGGRPSNGGQYFNDVFDIYTYFIHKGDKKAALEVGYAAASDDRKEWATALDFNMLSCNGIPIGQGAIDAYVEKEVVTYEETRSRQAELYQLAKDRGYSPYTILPPLPGFIGRVADWIEHEFMHYDQPEIAKLAAIAAAATFVGRKDAFGGAKPMINAIAFGITGVGKQTVASFINKLMFSLERAYPDLNGMLHYFEPMNPSEGVKAYNNECSQRLSAVIITAEAGMQAQSTAGDRKKVNGIIMDNVAKDAYEALTFTSQASGMKRVYGMNHSLIAETTIESNRGNMTLAEFTTGQAARRVTLNFDVSRGNTRFKEVDAKTTFPSWLLNGFSKLAHEALANEDFHAAHDGETLMPSELFVQVENSYAASPEVKELFTNLGDETLTARKANTSNTADLDWGHKNGRRSLIYKQVGLLFARTDFVVYGGHRVVTMEAVQAAVDIMDASYMVENALMGDMGNPLDILCNAVNKNATTIILEKRRPNKLIKNYSSHNANLYLSQGILPWSYFMDVGNIASIADGMATGSYSKKRVFDDAYSYGEQLGLWEMQELASTAVTVSQARKKKFVKILL